MSTLSPKLGLKRPDDTDPFLTADFVSNYNILDAAPGAFICTSSTRPAWGSAQAGRTIFLTDWKCFQYWDGAAWQATRDASCMFSGAAVFSASLGKSTTTTYNMITLTTPRSGTLAMIMNFLFTADARLTQSMTCRIVLDGGDILMGGFSDAQRFVGDPGDTTAQNQGTLTCLAIGNVAAGTHTIGGKAIIGGYNTSVTLVGIKTFALLSTYSSSQIL
jgi:hypothetical protein